MQTRDTPSVETGDQFVHTTGVEYEATDGTTLSANVFRPVGSEPVPVLLKRTPYGAPSIPTSPLATAALDAGYGVVIADTRGRGQSQGQFEPWVHERDDGHETVAWVRDQPWCSGSIGMFGGSSAATTQLLAAAEQPEGLNAICPQFAPSDIHGSDFFQDGAMSALTLLSWSFGWIAPHTAERLAESGHIDADTKQAVESACYDALDAIPDLAKSRPLVGLPERVFADVDLPPTMAPADLVPHWDLWLSHPDYDEFWASFDAEQLYDELDVPALHITGWHDLCQYGTMTNYLGMTEHADTTDQHLIVGPWAHRNQTDRLGDVDLGVSADSDVYELTNRQLSFFDYHLKDAKQLDSSAGTDDELSLPDIETFRMSPTGGDWEISDSWPPSNTETIRWHLSHGDRDTHRLTRDAPEQSAALSYEHDPRDPIPTRGGPLCCRDATREPGIFEQPAVPDRDDVLVFISQPLPAETTIAGPIDVSLVVDSSQPDTDFTAKLLHVTDETAYNICDGICRVSYNHDGELDGPTRLKINLWHTHYTMPEGDQLALHVASSNWPRFDPHPGTTDPWMTEPGDVETAYQEVFLGPQTQSWLSTPII